MSIHDFGSLADGRSVRRLELGSAPGPVLHVLTLGASVHRLEVTGGDGKRRNVVLGYATPSGYLASTSYVGGTIGRYANRIARGRLELGGAEIEVATNDRGHHLHGGPDGFDRRLWEVVEHGPAHAELRLESPDGDQGFPGSLTTHVRYEVTENGVRIDFRATTDAATIVNLTNHAYFNLDGDDAGTIADHELTVHATHYTPVDDTGIPLGDHVPVAGTAYDFRSATAIGAPLHDHNLVLDGSGWRQAAVLESRRTSTRLTVLTDQPGLQVYTCRGDGIALEPQLFPDTPHHPEWPSAQLLPGETYRSAIAWDFASWT